MSSILGFIKTAVKWALGTVCWIVWVIVFGIGGILAVCVDIGWNIIDWAREMQGTIWGKIIPPKPGGRWGVLEWVRDGAASAGEWIINTFFD